MLMALPVKELDVIIDATENVQVMNNTIIYKSWVKTRKVNALSKLVGDSWQKEARCPIRELYSLQKLASCALSKFPKVVLNAAYAAYTYHDHHEQWISNSPFGHCMDISGSEGKKVWFSYPEVNSLTGEVGEPIVRCIDGHHLFVNLRVKICKDGIQCIRKEAWHAVADYDSSIISNRLVIDLIDKQRNSYAKKTFSEEVEVCMRHLDFGKEADFCKLVREWYHAEDDRAISSNDRVVARLAFRDFLLKDVELDSFPPYGLHVNGLSHVSFEGLKSSIDRHIQLYRLSRKGAYNQRVLSSLENETFFGTLGAMERTRLGCPRSVNISRILASITEIMNYRQDPNNRTFQTRTSRNAVHPDHKLESLDTSGLDDKVNVWSRGDCQIIIRDHFFDTQERARRKPKRKTSRISGPQELGRGILPVRQHHRTDEWLILAERRSGIN